jgi:hypothetical protein
LVISPLVSFQVTFVHKLEPEVSRDPGLQVIKERADLAGSEGQKASRNEWFCFSF